MFGNPERAKPRLSSDGKYIAYIAPDDRNILQVWLREVDREEAQKLTNDKRCRWHDDPSYRKTYSSSCFLQR